MLTLEKDPLTILATTRNYDSSNKVASLRILQIYQKLKDEKTLTDQEIETLLREALELKKTPEKDISLLLSPSISLLCFPYAGGSSSLYESWSSQLPKAIKVEKVEYPGRGIKGNTLPLKRFEDLLLHLELEVLSKIKGPFAFFGHSLGALVAFELSSRLQDRHGIQPISVFLSGCPSPDTISSISSLNKVDDEEFIHSLESLNGTPQELMKTVDFKEVFLPILRADFSLLDDYRPMQKCMKCPLVIFGGKQDSKVDIKDLSKWSSWTDSGMTLIEIEGDHFFIRQPKEVLTVIEEILCPQLF